MTQQTNKRQKRVQKHYSESDYKMVLMFFGSMDMTAQTIEAVKDTPFYSQKVKSLINTLNLEIDSYFKLAMQIDPNFAFSGDWNAMKTLPKQFLQTIYDTPIDSLNELAAVLMAYREGGIKVVDEQPDNTDVKSDVID